MKKQFKEAMATIFFLGWYPTAVVLRTLSSFVICAVLDPDIVRTIVLFL